MVFVRDQLQKKRRNSDEAKWHREEDTNKADVRSLNPELVPVFTVRAIAVRAIPHKMQHRRSDHVFFDSVLSF